MCFWVKKGPENDFFLFKPVGLICRQPSSCWILGLQTTCYVYMCKPHRLQNQMTCQPHSKTVCHLSLFHKQKKGWTIILDQARDWPMFLACLLFFLNIYSIVIRPNPKQGSKIRPERSTRVYQKYFFLKKYQKQYCF